MYLSKYLTISINLINHIKTDSELSTNEDLAKKIGPFVPNFLKKSTESLITLLERLNSTGLSVKEIDDILASIGRETVVHVRRTGKKRLHCKSFLERSPSEDEELFKPAADLQQ